MPLCIKTSPVSEKRPPLKRMPNSSRSSTPSESGAEATLDVNNQNIQKELDYFQLQRKSGASAYAQLAQQNRFHEEKFYVFKKQPLL